MKVVLRSPLVSLVGLATYLAVHVFAGALHHHQGAELLLGGGPTAYQTSLQFRPTGPAHDDDLEENCLLCSVLHLNQTLPTTFYVEAVTDLTGQAFSAAAILRPSPLETATHARSPPAA